MSSMFRWSFMWLLLSGAKTSLSPGPHTWRHQQVLRCLPAATESQSSEVNSLEAEGDKMDLICW